MGSQGKVSEMIQILKEIVNYDDSEIYSMLVACRMDHNETAIHLLSQDPFQEVKSRRGKKKDTEDQAESSRRRIPNRGAGSMPHGYMHSGFQQGFPVGNNQAPYGMVSPPSAPSLQHQNETSAIRAQVNRPYLRAAPGGGVYLYSTHTGEHPHSLIQAQQLYLQQLSQQTAMSLDRLHHHHQHHHHQHHHHHHHHYHHQQSDGGASSRTREHLWPNNN